MKGVDAATGKHRNLAKIGTTLVEMVNVWQNAGIRVRSCSADVKDLL
jgi:hypothetical protein